ncbi:hypothetical protein TNCV_533011 [Trichonephila clavipes]|nr:hypothetical protein TNCV_533011 [Trichonephila clavipes]
MGFTATNILSAHKQYDNLLRDFYTGARKLERGEDQISRPINHREPDIYFEKIQLNGQVRLSEGMMTTPFIKSSMPNHLEQGQAKSSMDGLENRPSFENHQLKPTSRKANLEKALREGQDSP